MNLITMKQYLLALLALISVSTATYAQSKVAHIDVQQLLMDMPEMKAAQEELKKLEATYRADIESSVAELQKKLVTYQNEAASKTAEENKARADELQGAERNIGNAEQAAMGELQRKQQDLFSPISEKAKLAIEKVAQAQGFDYVMDASPGSGLIVFTGKDLMAEVKKELGF
ncbi:MAG: OmpH family outer membrane protein [Bacteroidetes bacterium]|nr:OmpH family outer membrane protein [Bacteroidota bacterium]